MWWFLSTYDKMGVGVMSVGCFVRIPCGSTRMPGTHSLVSLLTYHAYVALGSFVTFDSRHVQNAMVCLHDAEWDSFCSGFTENVKTNIC